MYIYIYIYLSELIQVIFLPESHQGALINYWLAMLFGCAGESLMSTPGSLEKGAVQNWYVASSSELYVSSVESLWWLICLGITLTN